MNRVTKDFAELLGKQAPEDGKRPPLKRAVEEDPLVDPEELRRANARHDSEHGDPLEFQHARYRRGWQPRAFMRGKKRVSS